MLQAVSMGRILQMDRIFLVLDGICQQPVGAHCQVQDLRKLFWRCSTTSFFLKKKLMFNFLYYFYVRIQKKRKGRST